MYYDSQNREIEDAEGDNMRRDRLEQQEEETRDEKEKTAGLELWQVEEIIKLLATPLREGERGNIITSTVAYGESLYHIIGNRFDSLQIDQIEVDEKYQQRIRLYPQEIAPLLKFLLLQYLEEHKPKEQRSDDFLSNDALGELDDHPF